MTLQAHNMPPRYLRTFEAARFLGLSGGTLEKHRTYTSVAFGTLIGPSCAGFAFDVSHSYMLPILASACVNIVAGGIVAGTSKAAAPVIGAAGRT